MKDRSTFFNDKNLENVRRNSEGSEAAGHILDCVKKWDAMSRDELWRLMYSSSLMRSHMVWSDGYCPACKEIVSMYAWEADPFARPWKLRCPHCNNEFPGNDFGKYYESGLDERNEFRHELADRSLLFNTGAPNRDDPMHTFGVDDGSGYIDGDKRWMFAACYMLHGLWEKVIFAGILNYASAHLITGDKEYARRCGILLDRLADLFPDFDFYRQGVMYEEDLCSRGYVSYWANSSYELLQILFAYDAVFESLKDDDEFISFICEKSERYSTPYRKRCFADIQMNIEGRIFSDAVAKKWKISANYPRTEIVIAVAKLVLTDWPAKPEDMKWNVYCILWWAVEEDLKMILEKSTEINGLSGEKGLHGYGTIAPCAVAEIMSIYNLYDENIIRNMLKIYPGMLDGIKFYINAWMLNSYYPGCGDSAQMQPAIKGMPFPFGHKLTETNSVISFMNSFEGYLWKLFKATGDLDLIRCMYNSENFDMDKCFSNDLSLDETPEEIRRQIEPLMAEHGTEIAQTSCDYDRWKLAVLHSGRGENRRAAYLDHDSGGVHGHNDGMNIGLFAKGMIFMPDLGTPPHHRGGGWYSRFFYWNRSAASHNTVIVDRKEHRDFCYTQRDVNGGQGVYSESGETVFLAEGSWIRAVSANDPMIVGERAERFERTLAIVDVSEDDCYFFDVFRVKGGKEHVKLTKGYICDLETNASDYRPYLPEKDPYGMCFIDDKNPEENFNYTIDDSFRLVRDAMIAGNVPESFQADFRYTGKYNRQLGWPEGRNYRLRYHDLTDNADIITFTSFSCSYKLAVAADKELKVEDDRFPEEMLPGVAVRRKASKEEELESVFIGIYEGTNGENCLRSAKRLVAGDDMNRGAVAFSVETKYGTDLIIAGDAENRDDIKQEDWGVRTDALLSVLRKSADGICRLSMVSGSYYEYEGIRIEADQKADIYEKDVFC